MKRVSGAFAAVIMPLAAPGFASVAGAAAAAPSPSLGSAFLSQVARGAAAANASWAADPGKYDYNEETDIPGLPISVEFIFASLFVLLMASVPAALVVLVGGGKLTKAHMAESACLIAWLCAALFMFTNVLKFNSAHWTGARPLTLVEAVYLLSQILTTVGYGDITPAFPRGQVWVAINVILALCLYGSLIMEVADLISQRVAKALEGPPQSEDEVEATSAREALHALRQWEVPPPAIDMRPLMKSAAGFTFFATVGVLFWHYYPGEEKTWLQAVYMSVITLSTVGFAWFNATTEGGKVFGAFWMLFGVASLAAVIGSFVELMITIKAKERRDPSGEKLQFYRLVKYCTRPLPSLGDNGMDAYDFLKFGILLGDLATEEEVQNIEARFAELADADGTVSCAQIAELEGPPAAKPEAAAPSTA